jgi:hypothetical protein
MQTPAAVLNIGVDIAKDTIVVACSEGSFPVRELVNQRTAVLSFLKSLPAGSRIGVESTGTYHELFAEVAHQLGFLVFLLNPKDTRHYAKAVGLRGKTDRVDAELIARMIAHEHTTLHAWTPPTPQQREIDRLLKRRARLISLREAVAMSLHELDGFADELKALRTRFNQLIARSRRRWSKRVMIANRTYACAITASAVIGTAHSQHPERVPVKSADALSPSPAGPATGYPDSIAANAASPNADRANCAGCRAGGDVGSKTKTWRPPTSIIGPRDYPHGASHLARRIARTAWSIYTYKTELTFASRIH